jgi:Dolichyl-phosphate-mannose-protein mannosyltransferase
LQFYVAALGFLLAPPGTVSARLPFVVVGALSLWILYRVGGELFAGTVIRLAVPLAGATSIHFLSAARQSRYYVLVVLFTCCILWEFVRYLKEPAYAHRWGFYLRLGLWGVLLYLSNYLSFGGLWASLAVFVLVTGDRTLVVRFFMTSAALAAALGFHFLLVHADFAKTVFGHAPAPWRNYFLRLLWHAKELFRMIPLIIILPAAWYVFIKRKQRGPVAWMALLTTLIVIVSVIFVHRCSKTINSALRAELIA